MGAKTSAWIQFSRVVIPQSELSGLLSHHQQQTLLIVASAQQQLPVLDLGRGSCILAGFMPLLKELTFSHCSTLQIPNRALRQETQKLRSLFCATESGTSCFSFFLNHNCFLGDTGRFIHRQFFSVSKNRETLYEPVISWAQYITRQSIQHPGRPAATGFSDLQKEIVKLQFQTPSKKQGALCQAPGQASSCCPCASEVSPNLLIPLLPHLQPLKPDAAEQDRAVKQAKAQPENNSTQ